MRDAACATSQPPPRPVAPTKYQPKRWKDLSTAQYNKLSSIEKSRYDAVSCNIDNTHMDWKRLSKHLHMVTRCLKFLSCIYSFYIVYCAKFCIEQGHSMLGRQNGIL